MALYKFKVANAAGKVQERLIEGDNQADATRRLKSQGVVPIAFLGLGDDSGGASPSRGFRKRFDATEFTDRLVPLLEAEIPLEKALSIVEDTSENEHERELVSSLRRGLHEGKRMSQLIKGRGREFPRMYSSIVEAGEEAGALPRVMAQLRDFMKMSREMKDFLISASIYPLVVMVVCMAVIVFLLTVVVPRFATVLTGSGGAPSGILGILLTLSSLMQSYWWVSFLVVAAIAYLAREIMFRDGPIKKKWDEVVLKLPFLGRIVLLANIGRQVRTMAILMRSGVHLLDTVAISARVIQNHKIRASIDGLAGGLRRGERLSHALSRSAYMPTFVLRMLSVGEETGNTDEMLSRVADRYEDELRITIKRALSWFEPLIIVILGGIVGVVVLALFLGVLDMQNSI